MSAAVEPPWLAWARELQSIAQNGLTYAQDPFDQARYERIRALAAEMMATATGVPAAELAAVFTAQTGHATPKVDVRGAVFRGDRVLLVRERADGGWTLPGGWADPGESPAEATAREVFEESGYRTRAVKLAALYERSRHGHGPHPFAIYKVFFLCDLLDEVPAARREGDGPPTHQETDGVAFYPVEQLPPLSRGRVTAAQIARLYAHYRHPEWPADFD